MPFVCPKKPTYKVLDCGLCEKLWPIVSMQTHSPLMLKFSLLKSSGRERECLLLQWQENQMQKWLTLWYMQFPLTYTNCRLAYRGKHTHTDVEFYIFITFLHGKLRLQFCILQFSSFPANPMHYVLSLHVLLPHQRCINMICILCIQVDIGLW